MKVFYWVLLSIVLGLLGVGVLFIWWSRSIDNTYFGLGIACFLGIVARIVQAEIHHMDR